MFCGTKVIVQNSINSMRIDNTHFIDNWMSMAHSSFDANNYEEAYQYFTKVVETQPTNWSAVFYKGLSAAWQSSIAKPRIKEAIVGLQLALPLVSDSSSLSEEEKNGIRFNFAEDLDAVIDAYHTLSVQMYYDNDELYADNMDVYFNAFSASEKCIEYGKIVLSTIPTNNDNIPTDLHVVIMKHICDYCVFMCDYYCYYLDYSKESLQFGGLSVANKQKYIDLYDEFTYEIRKVDSDFLRNNSTTLNRVEPPTIVGMHNLARSELNKKLQRKIDMEMDERREKEKALEQQKYWDTHPDEYQKYLSDKRELISRINNDILIQQQIIDANKSLFGDNARKRKAAQSQIERLKRELVEISIY